MNIRLLNSGVNKENRRAKFAKAMAAISKALRVPVKRASEPGAEPYFYPFERELSDRWTGFYAPILRRVYETVAAALDLPRVGVETLRKAVDYDKPLRYRGAALYNPETGAALKARDFDALISAVEAFLNRNTKDAGKRLVLDAAAMGKLLRRLAKYQTSSELEKARLGELTYRRKSFDWIREDMKNIQEAFRVDGREMSREELARYQVAMDYVAHKVTGVNNHVKDEIRDCVLNGIIERRGKSQVSQDLFNRLGALNRDWKRVADTELVNTLNLAGILDEVTNAPPGENIYFKRYERPGRCPECAAFDGKVVLWSNAPLGNEKIKDEHTDTAIWEGKAREGRKATLVTGTLHPNCRGGWLTWDAAGARMDAMAARVGGNAGAWDRAVELTRSEYKEKGVAYPHDQTKGYLTRINERYRDILKQETEGADV